ncbi:MAG TPA: response regulator transcription factor [Candidatus Sulfopaludibacter sp.]|nr:response regulator transcription factor [Candidatus Sulfopaludibacter sp.]
MPDLQLVAPKPRLDILVVHSSSGISLSELRELHASCGACRLVLWGEGLTGEFAFQAIQLGVRSILPGTTPVNDFLEAVRKVHEGGLYFENGLIESVLLQKRIVLTARQGQIVSLVAQGLKNKEIAYAMGITEGTVKVYLYKLFKKLGMHDRLEMALYGRQNLFAGRTGLESVSAPVGPAPFRFPRGACLALPCRA